MFEFAILWNGNNQKKWKKQGFYNNTAQFRLAPKFSTLKENGAVCFVQKYLFHLYVVFLKGVFFVFLLVIKLY